MKFEIKNRWTGKVQSVAEIECDEGAGLPFKIGLAVKWAFKRGGNLSGADLSGANLSEADLRGADLDFSAWPLSCRGTQARADDRLISQLLFHATRQDVSQCSGGVREAVEFLRGMAVCNLFPEYRGDVRKTPEFLAG